MGTVIQGCVSDAAGRPVADAAVFILESPGDHPDLALLTGPDGRYALPWVATPGTYRVGASGPLGEGSAALVITGHETSAELDIRLAPDGP